MIMDNLSSLKSSVKTTVNTGSVNTESSTLISSTDMMDNAVTASSSLVHTKCESGMMMFDPDKLDNFISVWNSTGGILYHEEPLEPGLWTRVLDAHLTPHLAINEACQISHNSNFWKLNIKDNPLSIEKSCNGHIPVPMHTVMITGSRDYIPIKTLLHWYKLKVSHCWLREANGWNVITVDALLSQLLYHRKIKRFIKLLSPTLRINDHTVTRSMGTWLRTHRGFADIPTAAGDSNSDNGRAIACEPTGVDLWHREIERDNYNLNNNAQILKTPNAKNKSIRVMHYIGSLSSGGAERQLCNLTIGLKKQGYAVSVRTCYEPEGEDLGHYLHLLTSQGLLARAANLPGSSYQDIPDTFRWDLLNAVPDGLRPHVTRLALELAIDPPEILHCWLDHPNIIGGLAGFIAGIPHLLFSTRNSNPTNFPRLYAPYIDTWYRVLAKSRRIHWQANSHSGALSYSQWLDLPLEDFHVILNGLFAEHFERPDAKAQREARLAFGLPADSKVVAVVNRFSEEKQPELMLKIISMVLKDIPKLKVLLAGAGPLEDRIRYIIKKRKLTDCVKLTGRVSDVSTVFFASHVLLLTSTLEGCPNVALEAQHFGLPVVATAGGGTVDAVMSNETGFVHGVNDAVSLAMSLRTLLVNDELRNRLGRQAQLFVDDCFSIDQLVALTSELYDIMLTGSSSKTRIVTPKPKISVLHNKPVTVTSSRLTDSKYPEHDTDNSNIEIKVKRTYLDKSQTLIKAGSKNPTPGN